MTRYFIELQYNGQEFHGWQIQPNAVSVQENLEQTLSLLLNKKIKITGAGRTDTSVHASYFVAHFDYSSEINIEQLITKWNNFLSKNITILSFQKTNNEAHARFSATNRTYHYIISTKKQIFLQNLSYKTHYSLDVEKMNEAAKILFEYEDFTSFSKLHTDVKTNNCTIYSAEWVKKGDLLIFTIKANRFLRNMVRAVVGTLLEVGKNKISVEKFRNIIESKNRGNAGFSVPGNALFLSDIEYPIEIFNSKLDKSKLFPF